MKSLKNILKKIVLTIIAICFWLFVWQFLSHKIDKSIFLPSPEETMLALKRIGKEKDFWRIIFNSFGKIAKGFGLAVVCGILLGVIAHFCKIIDFLLSPLMKLIKAVPVASFIILALLWIKSQQLSVLISFIMVMPVIYINLQQGFENVDIEILEMAKVYHIDTGKKMRFIYLPCLLPSFVAACKIGLGFCFKSGIAAEIIGLPAKSIGSELYKSKLYLMTDELFAWTVVIVLMSVFFEGICIYLLGKLGNVFARVNIVKSINIEKCDIDFKEKKLERKLELVEINKSFEKKQILKDINLQTSSKKNLCIYGASGFGKTTLLKVIAGVTKPDKGNITLFKNNKINDKIKISMVFQEDRLTEETDIYTNLYYTLGKDFSKENVDKHLEEVGLCGKGRTKVKELSGGMKRRVAIVRAILYDSDIILLDEAFKGLDRELRSRIISYVNKYRNNRILIMVTHDLNEGKEMLAENVDLSEINCV